VDAVSALATTSRPTRRSARTLRFEQKAFVLGAGYKLDANIGLKVENHFNRGYALPVASAKWPPVPGAKNWNLFLVAADFAF